MKELGMFTEYFGWLITLLLIAICFLFFALAWIDRNPNTPIEFALKDWLKFRVTLRLFYLILCLTILLFLHQGQKDWAIKKLENKPEVVLTKSKFISTDEGYLDRGITEYDQRDYDNAQEMFGQIHNLEGPTFVRWKFYEALCLVRKIQYQKAVMLNEPDHQVVESALVKLKAIAERWQDDILYPDSVYWYAQCLRYFKNDNEKSFDIFQNLLSDYSANPYFTWKEECIYYSALILYKKGDNENRKKAIFMLRELNEKYGQNSIELIEKGRDSYTVRWAVGLISREL